MKKGAKTDMVNQKIKDSLLFEPYRLGVVSVIKASSVTQNINLTIKCRGCNMEYKFGSKIKIYIKW